MKKILLVIMILSMVLSGCKSSDGLGATDNDDSISENVTEDVYENDPSSSEISNPELEDESAYEMPSLPDLDFEGMTFKDDGYEIVEYKSLSDGDTANFKVGGMTMACRFLAIDTPETSGNSGLQPWALAAKAYTQNALENAEVIILEKDLESDIVDDYGRLLAWIWVDGKLLNYQLVEEGLAWVKYLYGDYKYNPVMITLESKVQKTKVKIWGEDDPNYDYDDTVREVSIEEAKAMQTGSTVTIRGVVTNYIGQNAFITDGTASVYIYANKYNYGALDDIGTEIELTGKIIEYNGLMEVSSIVDKKITVISEGNEVVPTDVTIDEIGEDIEGDLIRLTDVTIERVHLADGGGYDIVVYGDEGYTSIRIDKYLEDYPDPEILEKGMVIDVVGSVGQYMENYQVMICNSDAITFK